MQRERVNERLIEYILNDFREFTTVLTELEKQFSSSTTTLTTSIKKDHSVSISMMCIVLYLLIFFQLIIKSDATEIISLVAGGYYTTGSSGDNGPASSALLSQTIYGLAVDNNFIYIADNGNNRIRRITQVSGIIKTVVGGGSNVSSHHIPATSANLLGPMGIVLDGHNNLYTATWDNRILYVTMDTNPMNPIVTTIAGSLKGLSGSSGDTGLAIHALLNTPFGLAFDSTHTNLYITCSNAAYNAVRKISITTGIITLIAGGVNFQGSTGDGGPAMGALFNNLRWITVDQSSNIYVSDYGNNKIRVLVPTVNVVINAVPGGGGHGTLTDGGGGTMGNYTINPGSSNNYTIATFAGTGSSGYSNGYGYSSDNIPATSARLNKPSGLAMDVHNNLYVADNYNNRIRIISPRSPGGGGNIITTIAGTGMAGAQGDGGDALLAQIFYPDNLVVFNNSIYFVDASNYVIRVLQPSLIAPTAMPTNAPSWVLEIPVLSTKQIVIMCVVMPLGFWLMVWCCWTGRCPCCSGRKRRKRRKQDTENQILADQSDDPTDKKDQEKDKEVGPNCNVRTIQTHGVSVWLQELKNTSIDECKKHQDRIIDHFVNGMEKHAPDVAAAVQKRLEDRHKSGTTEGTGNTTTGGVGESVGSLGGGGSGGGRGVGDSVGGGGTPSTTVGVNGGGGGTASANTTVGTPGNAWAMAQVFPMRQNKTRHNIPFAL